MLTGEVASTAPSQTPTCVVASVDPTPLHITVTAEASCGDPSVPGRTVGAVIHDLPHSNNATIQIADVDPRTGQLSVGPVVMTYASYSDTRPVTAYGGGWFWIYDNSTTTSTTTVNQAHPGHPELLQISSATGAVVDVVTMPALFRPFMAADGAGLWIGNSIQGTTSPALLRVPPGAATPEVVIPSTAARTCWLLGSGDTLWAGIGPIAVSAGPGSSSRLARSIPCSPAAVASTLARDDLFGPAGGGEGYGIFGLLARSCG